MGNAAETRGEGSSSSRPRNDAQIVPYGGVASERKRPATRFRALGWMQRKRWLLAWLATLPLAVLRAGTLAETDTFWQIRTGLLTLQEGRIPATDPFSWTVHGQPWTLNSWGFNVFVALAYRFAGLPGAAIACAALVAAVMGLVLLHARRLGASAAIAVGAVFLASPLLIAWFSARPQLVDYIAVLILVLLLRRLLSRPDARTVAAVGLLTVLWVNLHAGALLGVAIIAAVSALVLVRRSTRARGGWCLAALVTAAAGSLINPYGIGLLAQTAQVQDASAGVVTEWLPINLADPSQSVMLGLGVSALVIAVRRWNVVFAGALSVTLLGGIGATRILPILLLLALPVLAAFASHLRMRQFLYRHRNVLAPGAAAALITVLVMAFSSLGHLGRPDPTRYSTAVVERIPAGCHLFNSYDLGGFVLLERPDVAVSLDSRNDLYGPERVLKDQHTIDGKGNLEQELSGAGCVLVPPDVALGNYLRQSQNWQLTAADDTAMLFVRR